MISFHIDKYFTFVQKCIAFLRHFWQRFSISIDVESWLLHEASIRCKADAKHISFSASDIEVVVVTVDVYDIDLFEVIVCKGIDFQIVAVNFCEYNQKQKED